jgi:hypothetical protein
MNRRGVQQWVVIVIIAMFTLLVVFPIFNQIQASTLKEEVVDRCRASVLSRSTAKSAVGTDVFRLECDRDQVFFKDEDSRAVNGKILEEVKQCYRSMGEGKLDFSSAGHIFDENHCVICTSFEFLPASKAKKYDSSTLVPYLDRVPYTKDQSWGEYLKESKASEKSGLLFNIDTSIDPDNKYLLFFKYAPASNYDWLKSRFTGENNDNNVPSIVLEKFPKQGSEFQGCEKLLN